jgi:glutamyl-tRNA synthetase
VWAHVPVLVNEQRKKLSKRRDKVAVEQYREEGILPEAMVNYLMTLGWAPIGDTEIVPWEQIVQEFSLESVNHSPAFFDIKKLQAFNGEYIRKMSLADFVDAANNILTSDAATWPAERYKPEVFAAMAPLVQTRVAVMAEVVDMVDFLFMAEPPIDDAAFTKAFSADFAIPTLTQIATAFETIEWNAESIKQAVEAVGTEHEVKLGKLQGPLRIAITGRTVGPPLFEPIELLGRDESLRRIRAALSRK